MPYQTRFNPLSRQETKELVNLREQIGDKIKKFYNLKFKKDIIIPGVDLLETAGKYIGEEELIMGTNAVLDGWWTEGKYADEFARQLTKYLGVRYCIFVNSGSSANLIAFASLTSHILGKKRIHPADEVITVAAAFPTTVNPIIQLGCTPVFVDIDRKTLNIDWSKLEKAISARTKAIMIAHTQGNPFNLEKVVEFAKKHKLWLVEDCCDALGAEYKGQKVGTFGDVATLSFYPAHQMTTGEGGAVLTNNPFIYRIAKSFRDWGRDCWCETGEDDACRRRFNWKFKNLPDGYDHKFVYSHLGYNLKFTDIQAAIGLAQLKRIPQLIEARRRNYLLLRNKLVKFNKYFTFQEAEKNSVPSWFGFMLTLTKACGFNVADIASYLNKKKIATRPLYCGNITLHPYFDNLICRVIGELKNTNYVMNHTFWIGIHPKLATKHIDYITKCIEEYLMPKRARKS
ncbi:lipopolysaccharide biosynthesis protein RfbH [Candidatus Roizmanbacteria bacterium]|nr:lipopolysaccharide biosynthesis protein RfbH [Candidatus Roizmanbacteria bacterium]